MRAHNLPLEDRLLPENPFAKQPILESENVVSRKAPLKMFAANGGDELG